MNKPELNRTFYRVFPLVLLLFFLAGCHNKTDIVRIGYVPIADNAQLFVGIEKGYYAQEGLKIDARPISSGPKVLEALLSKSAEGINIGFSSVVPIILARSQNLPIIAIAGGPTETLTHRTHAILVRSDSSIISGGDLAGKNIAINSMQNIEAVMLRRYLEKIGVDSASVRLVEIPFPQMESVLSGKSVDAVAAIEPYLTLALQHGKVRVVDYHYSVVEPRTVVSSYVTTDEWLQQNLTTVRRFVQATKRATVYIQNQEEESRVIIQKYTGVDEPTAKAMILPEFQAEFTTSDMEVWVDQMLQQKLLKTRVDINSLLRNFQ